MSTDQKTVLVVEDDVELREIVVDQLFSLNYKCLEADDHLGAIKQLKSTPTLDLLITDMVLPNGDGRMVYRDAKQAFDTIGTIFMSGYSATLSDELMLAESRITFMHKPFSLQQLREAILKVFPTGSLQT